MSGAIAATLFIALYGGAAWADILLTGLARPQSGNIFFRLYALHELPFLALLALMALALALAGRRARQSPEADGDTTAVPPLPVPDGRAVTAVAAVVVAVTLAATVLVMHRLLFSMDEFSVDFQARLFAGGAVRAAVPVAWHRFAALITPIFVAFRPTTGQWQSMYLPVYALAKAPFVALGIGELLNPMFAGLAVVCLAGVARRLWPDERLRPWASIALLVTSSEFIVTSASGYTMPAHLALNLAWLWLYLRDDARSWAGALAIGVLALGLHQPFPHALFVAPFLVRLVRDGRWSRVASAAVVYGVASVGWLLWLRAVQPVAAAGGGGLASVFALPSLAVLLLHGMNLTVLCTWQMPLMLALVVLALARLPQLPAVYTDLALGVLLTCGLYLLFPATQGHGWGYRYAFQLLGSLALLGAAGLASLQDVLGARRAWRLLQGALLVAVFIQLPLRLRQTERFVRPFAAANALIAAQRADVVLLRADSVWYGRDLVRNDPFLRHPVVVGTDNVRSSDRAVLRRLLPGTVVEITDTDLLRLGLTRWTHPVP
jgi:hypothetical protein